jgi:hypothetical protein
VQGCLSVAPPSGDRAKLCAAATNSYVAWYCSTIDRTHSVRRTVSPYKGVGVPFPSFLCRCQMCWSEPKCGGTTFNTDACSAMGWSFCASAVNAKRSGYAADVCRSCADARDVLTFLPTPQCSSQLTSFLITTCSMNATAVTMPPGVCAKVLAELNSYSGYLLADPRSFLSAVAFSDLQALVKYWW